MIRTKRNLSDIIRDDGIAVKTQNFYVYGSVELFWWWWLCTRQIQEHQYMVQYTFSLEALTISQVCLWIVRPPNSVPLLFLVLRIEDIMYHLGLETSVTFSVQLLPLESNPHSGTISKCMRNYIQSAIESVPILKQGLYISIK